MIESYQFLPGTFNLHLHGGKMFCPENGSVVVINILEESTKKIFNPEYGSSRFIQKLINFYQSARRHILGALNLRIYSLENSISHKYRRNFERSLSAEIKSDKRPIAKIENSVFKDFLWHFKRQALPDNVYKSSSYLTENILRLHYKHEPFNAVYC
jgi:hypothetical protein